MNRIDRLMGIITLLQAKKYMTIRQLSEQFNISERTVFRDLKAIGEIGIPILFEPEKGYFVGQGFFLPPISLTLEEANALSLAEPLVFRFSDKSVQKHFNTALSKIKMVMGKAQREKLERSREGAKHFVPDKYEHLMPSTNYLTPLQNAIIHRQIVKVEYVNMEEKSSIRELEPIGLLFYSLNWHLIAWCHLRQDYRDFRVSRIKNLATTIQPFRIQEHISLKSYVENLKQQVAENNEHPLT
jgi:predicted DNA-binding transcriptional regulator YafY